MDTQAMDKLASKLGEVLPGAWDTLVRGAFINGVVTLCVIAVYWVAVAIGYHRFVKNAERGSEARLVFVFAVFVGFMITILGGTEGLMHVLTPEYAVFYKLLKAGGQ